MTNIIVSGDVLELAREAGGPFETAQQFGFEDARLGFRYLLLRLALGARVLSDDDRAQLLELGAIVSAQQDVKEVADRIRQRDSASPLTVAIASIAVAARGDKSAAVAGAALGAYLATASGTDPNAGAAVVGAMAGAVAVSTLGVIPNGIESKSWWQSEDPG